MQGHSGALSFLIDAGANLEAHGHSNGMTAYTLAGGRLSMRPGGAGWPRADRLWRPVAAR